MDYETLRQQLLDYSGNIKGQTAKTTDFMKIKNDIRAAYDAGAIDKETMKDLGDKATYAFKNMGKAPELAALPETIQKAGGKVGQLEGMKSTLSKVADEASDVAKKANRFGLVKKMLGVAAPIAGVAIGSMGVAEKAMAGDLKGALGQAYDTYVPDAAKPTELGNADFNPDMLNDPQIKEIQKRVFAEHIVDDGAREGKFGESVDHPKRTTINEEEFPTEKARFNKLKNLMYK